MSVRLMHLADLHLGAPLTYLGDKAAQRATELEAAFARALDSAAEKDVHAILIAGDLFNLSAPPPDLISRTKAALANAVAAGIPIILIPGTHDSYRYTKCVFRHVDFPGVDILSDQGGPILKKLNGRDVFFYGFSGGRKTGGDTPPFACGPEEGIHVALVHGPVVEAGHWTPSPRDFPLTPDEIAASGFDYVALGHHHNFREFRQGGATAVYPGTLEGLKFSEAGERYLVVAEVGEDGVSIEKTPHNQRTLSEIRIDFATSAVGSAEGLISAIAKRSDPTAIVRALLTGAADFVPAPGEIEPALAASFFHLEIADETSVAGGELIRGVIHEDTVRGMFARKMLERIEKLDADDRATAELALRLGIEQFVQAGDK